MELKDVINYTEKYWHKKYMPILIAILTPLILIYLICQFKVESLTRSQLIFIELITLLIIVFRSITNRLPKAAEGKCGILIAIETENVEQYKTIKSKLINTYHDLLVERSKLNFEVMSLKNHQIEILNFKSLDDRNIIKVLRKTNSLFIVYGSCISGNIESKGQYSIRLNAFVAHKTIPNELKQLLSNEMSVLIKKKIIISNDDDLKGFEVQSEELEITSKYILGIAMFLSGYFSISKILYEEINQNTASFRRNIESINLIKNRIPLRLFETYKIICEINYLLYRNTKELNYLDEMGKYCQLMEQVYPDRYSYILLSAIYFFLNGRQVVKAKDQILKCKKVKDPSWRYSDAFLSLYSGNLLTAYRKYKVAFKYDYDPENIFDIEDFIYMILEEEPYMYKLHFALGLINYFFKNDILTADSEFKKFISYSSEEDYSVLEIIYEIIPSLKGYKVINSTLKEVAPTSF